MVRHPGVAHAGTPLADYDKSRFDDDSRCRSDPGNRAPGPPVCRTLDLRRVGPRKVLPPSTRFFLNEERRTKVSRAEVLGAGRSLVAIPLWISTFSLAFVIYVLMQWLPIFVTSGGGSAARAGEAVGWFKLGGVVDGFICATGIERTRNPYPILSAFLIPACAIFVGMVMAPAGARLFIASVAISGVLLNGPLYASNGLVGRLFPTYVRTGGLAITAGVGRMGAMAGPFSAGLLLQTGWSVSEVLRAAPIPVLASVAFVSVLSLRERALVHRTDAA